MKMKYYLLEEACRTEETGNQYPQILKMSKDHDYDDDKGVYVFSRVALPSTKPDLKYLMLDDNAKLTDMLSAVMLRLNGFLISEKFKNLLQKYKLPEHQFYEAYIMNAKGEQFKYYWLQMLRDNDMKYVDFENSGFIISSTSIIQKDFRSIRIGSYSEYLSEREKLEPKQIIRISELCLNKEFTEAGLDIFSIPSYKPSWIISENLKNSIRKNELTGVSIEEARHVEICL